MSFLDTERQRAAWLILALGLGLLWVLWPFGTGLLGALVLYVVFAPLHRVMSRWIRPGAAAGVAVLLGLVLVLGPGISIVGLVANQAQDMATGVIRSPLLARLSEVRVGPYAVGAQLESVGSQLVSWVGSSAVGLIGTATRLGIELTIAFFGLYYLLVEPHGAWRSVRPFIPFSSESAEVLRERFRDVTFSTLVGTGLTAAVQGLLVALGFWVTGLSNPPFWGVVTFVLSILPVVGSGMVWGRRSDSRSGAWWRWATWTASSAPSSFGAGLVSTPSSPSSERLADCATSACSGCSSAPWRSPISSSSSGCTGRSTWKATTRRRSPPFSEPGPGSSDRG
jgi:predicted PurR-regulated permease PerM